MRGTPEARYLAKVDKRGPAECWPWLAGRNQGGYGLFKPNGSRSTISATKWAYNHFIGPTNGLFVCHTCDHPWCQNPAHWWLGTPKQNTADMDAKGRGRRPGAAPGEAHPLSKLSNAQRLEIQSRWPGESFKKLGVAFGVTTGCIQRVVHSKQDYAKELSQ